MFRASASTSMARGQRGKVVGCSTAIISTSRLQEPRKRNIPFPSSLRTWGIVTAKNANVFTKVAKRKYKEWSAAQIRWWFSALLLAHKHFIIKIRLSRPGLAQGYWWYWPRPAQKLMRFYWTQMHAVYAVIGLLHVWQCLLLDEDYLPSAVNHSHLQPDNEPHQRGNY